MNITVYLGSTMGTRPIYREAAEELGTWIGQHGYTLVYGGASVGLMGVLSQSVLDHGGKVIGVIPHFLEYRGVPENLTEIYRVETMAERKQKMLELGDCYIAFPGGTGTLEEIAEAVTREKLGLGSQRCIFYDVDDYYRDLENMFDKMVREGFVSEKDRKNIRFAHSLDDLARFIEGR